MMTIHNDMGDITAHMPASPYGIQKLDYEYLAHMFYADHGDGEVFNVATGASVMIRELAESIIKTIVESMSTGAGIVHEAERAGDIRDSRADVGKIAGWWRSEVGLVEGLDSL